MKTKNDILKQHISDSFERKTVSVDFTDLVMQKVEYSLENKTVFEPLISKKWWLIISSVAFFVILTSFGIESQITTNTWFTNLIGNGFEIPNLENYKSSITLSIGIFIILSILTVTDLAYRKFKHIT